MYSQQLGRSCKKIVDEYNVQHKNFEALRLKAAEHKLVARDLDKLSKKLARLEARARSIFTSSQGYQTSLVKDRERSTVNFMASDEVAALCDVSCETWTHETLQLKVGEVGLVFLGGASEVIRHSTLSEEQRDRSRRKLRCLADAVARCGLDVSEGLKSGLHM
jgi:hypothetical protein